MARSIAALRRLSAEFRPTKVYGCEVWRDLDWVPDHLKVVLAVSQRSNLQRALNGLFDSQISGGKCYDLAIMGRRLAHATFFESQSADVETGLIFAVDLAPLCGDDSPSLEVFTLSLVEALAEDIRSRLRRFV